ncbi:hypothetical protein, partial [Mesorhizobium sp. M7A.T.Ca.US.000.02.2.1]
MGGAVELNITSEPTGPEAPVQTDRPAHIPEKFWDADTKSVRTEALLQSYGELEKKVGAPKEEVQTPPAPEAAVEQTEAEVEEDADQKAAKAAADAAGIG